jgi:putative transcriptional regulator
LRAYIFVFISKMSKVKYNRIKVALVEKERKNQELAEFMNVHISTVSDWCTNSNQPSIPDLYKIAKFLKMDVRQLLFPTNFDEELDDSTKKNVITSKGMKNSIKKSKN